MPETIANFAYAWMSALIVLGLGLIAWLLKQGFDTVKEILKGILDALSSEKEMRMGVSAKLDVHIAECSARRATDPHLHHRTNDVVGD